MSLCRSTEDEYTPLGEVNTIQQLVLNMLHCLYGNEMPESYDVQMSHDADKASPGSQNGTLSCDSNGMSCDTSCDSKPRGSDGNGASCNRSHDLYHTSCDPQNFLQLQVHLHYSTKQSTPSTDLDEPPRDICDCTYL